MGSGSRGPVPNKDGGGGGPVATRFVGGNPPGGMSNGDGFFLGLGVLDAGLGVLVVGSGNKEALDGPNKCVGAAVDVGLDGAGVTDCVPPSVGWGGNPLLPSPPPRLSGRRHVPLWPRIV